MRADFVAQCYRRLSENPASELHGPSEDIVIALIAAAPPATLAPRDQQWHHIPPDASGAREVASRRKLRRLLDSIVGNSRSGVLKSSARLQRLPVRRELIRFGTIPLILHSAEQSRLILTGITRTNAQFVDAPGR